jgi:site-specific DNA-methyltransferase (adenine-specific)
MPLPNDANGERAVEKTAAKNATAKSRAPRNRTLEVLNGDLSALRRRLLTVEQLRTASHVNRTILGDCFQAFGVVPPAAVDLLILDPPYNLNKKFGDHAFSRISVAEYTDWLRLLFTSVKPLLKPDATVYVCGDWLTSVSIFEAASEHFIVRNRITWEREKGRGALANWKNASEDIWFCTVSDCFTFNVDAVKLRRRVLAPYRDAKGRPKDWLETDGGNFRDTHPSNAASSLTRDTRCLRRRGCCLPGATGRSRDTAIVYSGNEIR